MPSKRFFNLPEQKRMRIRQAALQELSRVPLSEISINQIIRSAGIPRGSFYEYFSDKYDLLSYVLSEFRQAQEQRVIEKLLAHDWDIFAAAPDVLDSILASAGEESFAQYKNIFASLAPAAKEHKALFRFDTDSLAEALMPHLPEMRLSLSTKEDVACLVELLITLLLTTVSMIFLNIERKEQLRSRFMRKLQMLRRGVAKHPLPASQGQADANETVSGLKEV